MRLIAKGLLLVMVGVVCASIVSLGHVSAETVRCPGTETYMLTDIYSVRDTVASPTKNDTLAVVYSDTLVPDGRYNYGGTISIPKDTNVTGVWVMLSPACIPGNTEWMLIRDHDVGVDWSFSIPVDTVFIRGAGTAASIDSTGICRYQLIIPQVKED